MYQGYIKLWRKLQDNSLWKQEKFTRGQAWIDLILLANHKPSKIMIRGIEISIERGQLAYSELTLAKRWKWSRGKVRRFLSYLSQKTVQQIKQETNNITSIITILNYESYQGNEQQMEHQVVHQTVQQTDTKRYTNNNVKNVKNDNKKYITPLLGEFKNVKLTSDELEKLKSKFNGSYQDKIENLSQYLASKGKKYKSHYATILNWDRRDKADPGSEYI